MLPLDDPRWLEYTSGYGIPYDASAALRNLSLSTEKQPIWNELFDELHHQGDLGTASYAAVPYLLEYIKKQAKLDNNALTLIAVIELERPHNAPIPVELSDSYFRAIESIPEIIVTHQDTHWDDSTMQSAMSCLALARNQREFARIYLDLDLPSGLDWLKAETGYDPQIRA
jgi:hypothetical protein